MWQWIIMSQLPIVKGVYKNLKHYHYLKTKEYINMKSLRLTDCICTKCAAYEVLHISVNVLFPFLNNNPYSPHIPCLRLPHGWSSTLYPWARAFQNHVVHELTRAFLNVPVLCSPCIRLLKWWLKDNSILSIENAKLQSCKKFVLVTFCSVRIFLELYVQCILQSGRHCCRRHARPV